MRACSCSPDAIRGEGRKAPDCIRATGLYFYDSKHLVKPWIEGFVANPLNHHASRYLRWKAVTE